MARYTDKNKEKAYVMAKAKSFALFGNECVLCGRTEDLVAHHWYRTAGEAPERATDWTNLVPLCPYCHRHTGKDAMFFKLRERIISKINYLVITGRIKEFDYVKGIR